MAPDLRGLPVPVGGADQPGGRGLSHGEAHRPLVARRGGIVGHVAPHVVHDEIRLRAGRRSDRVGGDREEGQGIRLTGQAPVERGTGRVGVEEEERELRHRFGTFRREDRV